MKKSTFLYTILTLLFFNLVSCKKEEAPPTPYLIVEAKNTVKLFSYEHQIMDIPVNTNFSYYVKPNVDWISVAAVNGFDAPMEVSVSENNTGKIREGYVTLSSKEVGVAPVSVKIRQAASGPYILLATDTASVGDDLMVTLDVKSNIQYETVLPSWLAVHDKVRDADSLTTHYTYMATSSNVNRTATVKFIGASDNWDVLSYFSVAQKETVNNDPESDLPTGDLFDVAFWINGALDYSPFSNTVSVGNNSTGIAPSVSYDQALQMYTAKFSKGKEQYYKLNFAGNDNFIEGFKKQFTLEVYFKPTVSNEAPSTVVGAMEGYGIGLQRYYASDPYVFWYNTTNDNNWPSVGTQTFGTDSYYDVVITYDGGQIKYYVNGNLNDMQNASGDVLLSSNAANYWFGIGGDANPNNQPQDCFSGEIAYAKFYSSVKSATEVLGMFNQIAKRKGLTKIADLQNAIVSILPDKIANSSGSDNIKYQNLYRRGWKLMNNIYTTDERIAAFLSEIN